MMRPLDLPEDELLPLMRSAMSEGVFSQDFLLGLRSALEGHLSQQEFERYVETLQAEGRQPAAEPAKTDGLLALLATLEPIDEDWPEIDDPPPEPVEL